MRWASRSRIECTTPPWIARIAQYCCCRSRQTDALIGLLEQHHAPVTGQIPAAEIGLDHPTPQSPKFDLVSGTLWHGEASLQIARNSLESFSLRRFRLLADEISGLGQIRKLVGLNLILGLITIVVAILGRLVA
jgi:hypothetical protein